MAYADAKPPDLLKSEQAPRHGKRNRRSREFRDVLAHCGCALTRAAEGRLHRFTPELNEIDVDERRSWPLAQVLAELEQGYGSAAAAVTAAQGKLDGLALGEWVHGGDVREALGEPGPYESEGVADALLLLVERSRRRAVPPTLVRMPDREVRLGAGGATGTPPAGLDTDVPTLIRLCTGRRPDPTRFRLTGADPAQLTHGQVEPGDHPSRCADRAAGADG